VKVKKVDLIRRSDANTNFVHCPAAFTAFCRAPCRYPSESFMSYTLSRSRLCQTAAEAILYFASAALADLALDRCRQSRWLWSSGKFIILRLALPAHACMTAKCEPNVNKSYQIELPIFVVARCSQALQRATGAPADQEQLGWLRLAASEKRSSRVLVVHALKNASPSIDKENFLPTLPHRWFAILPSHGW
jgi:hypothetical protein